MRRLLITVVLTVASGAFPVAARAGQDAPASESPFEVARPGDTRLSCEALREEIDALEAELDEMQAATDRLIASMRPGSRAMPGREAAAIATAVGGAVVPGAGLAIAAASNQAMMGARSARRERGMDVLSQHTTEQAVIRETLLNRIDHLSRISVGKRC